ncbi:hypothetical protein KAFR_0A07840 [Kazachstania africana CBS 2517]|uniref:Uncharacterized protein n=1 Tax=Kazachstania africana (strain ATCC 22294 / BCRC 22015 / CBS 2517 / CECT 1963 / NBRC 1671 / NRRL Y-8276) TaxID=1071382 RepID=H2APB8_KAZAF|nr:hypothetical protein KAFR_0A07840 [Kazachstania africana CBS 2517]CCF56218.1 hypothetical protein KAFR_0A07840 [Kazachstania africana CBS 2517]
MSPNLLNDIKWPDESSIVRRRYQHPTLVALRSLFHNIGILSSLGYLILLFVVQPCLAEQFRQRNELAVTTLLRLRALVSTLQKRLKVSPVTILGFNQHDKYIERATQTDNDSTAPSQTKGYLTDINEKLRQAAQVLEVQNLLDGNQSDRNTVAGLTFQMKLLVDQVELTDQSKVVNGKCRDVIDNLRTIKGTYVNGGRMK